MKARILFISTPVSPIGAGDGGGVETTLKQVTPLLAARGHTVAVVAPAESKLPSGVVVYGIPGNPPFNAATGKSDIPITVSMHGVLERMWDKAAQVQCDYDVIISMSYDWLSYYIGPFFPIPVLHWITMGSCIEAVDMAIAERYQAAPQRFAFFSKAQAATYPFVDENRALVLPGAVDPGKFRFYDEPEAALIWVARISPEKGLEDAVRVAERTELPLHVCGKVQDETYWREILRGSKREMIIYHGLLQHDTLQKILGRAMAMLVTPKWLEAFGLTVIEALACGTPVIAYDQGGPREIIQHGKSGFLVPQNDIDAMADAVRKVPTLSRTEARRRAEQYSVTKLASAIEQWIAMF